MPTYNSNESRAGAQRKTTRSRSANASRLGENARRKVPQPRNAKRPQRGYSLRGSNVRFSSRGGTFWSRVLALDFRAILMLVLGLLLMIALVLGITTAVRSCTAANEQPEGTGNPVDARVAAGVSEELTRSLAERLDEGEKIARLAAAADTYEDDRLIKLALEEPSAVDFVLSYPEAEKVDQPYGLAINAGEIPTLVCWDPRWGAISYAESAFAVTGSGPTAFSMAAMGLTGNTSHTPAVIAEKAATEGLARGSSNFAAGFISDYANEFGLEAHFYEPSADNINSVLENGTVVLAEVKAGTLTSGSSLDAAHWVLIMKSDQEGEVRVIDPTSTTVTAEPWSVQTVASAANAIYAVSAASTADTSE